MDNVRHAAALLSRATSVDAACRLLAELGFDRQALPLNEAARNDLKLHQAVHSSHIARGPGALRALIIEPSGISTRELIQHSARALSVQVPHLLWLIVSLQQELGEFALACWSPGRRAPRVVALVTNTKRVLESDAQTLCALASAKSDSDILTHVRWLELLGREAITRRFFRSLKAVVDLLADELREPPVRDERRELALLTVSRLLFLSFLETKGWLAGDFDFLSNQFARCMMGGGGYHRRVLHPLFFGTLNTSVSKRASRARAFGRIPFLNGGLFSRSFLEKKYRASVFSDEALGAVFGELLTAFRFTAREDAESWSETAVDPEILGKAFEALMASADRKSSGAFYTPQRLVEHVTESALVAALSPEVSHDVLRALLASGELPEPHARAVLLARVGSLRLLDPACGSGAFLVHALEKLTELRIRLGETDSAASVRRKVLAVSIFGVDINPMAVWLCQLRLWLAIVIDSADPDPAHVRALPNLDRQIRVGDSLAGGGFSTPIGARGKRLEVLRGRYARAVGPRKKHLARQLDHEERAEALAHMHSRRECIRYQRRDLVHSMRSRDLFGSRIAGGAALSSLRALRKEERSAAARERALIAGAALPFSFNAHFADVAGRGGFDVVVGNPPWVRIHNIGAAMRRELDKEFLSFSDGAWRAGAARAGSGNAFANQIDLASLFIERSLSLLADNGAVSLLVPAKLWRSLSGGGVRSLVSSELELTAIEDMTESRTTFDAAVYPSLIVGRKHTEPHAEHSFAAASHRKGSVLQWEMRHDTLPLDHSVGSPWLIVPAEVRGAFDRVSRGGIALADSHIGRPLLGVKTGLNSAFLVRRNDAHDFHQYVRPVVRGETMAAWVLPANEERIIWTHTPAGVPMAKLPDALAHHFAKHRAALERRADGKGSSRWWSLFRTEAASNATWRVVWCDFGKAPRAVPLPRSSEMVPLNTCYVARCRNREDALTLTALLNGPLAAAWLAVIAEPARGGYHRYLGWTVSLLPLPRDWKRAVEILSPLANDALRGVIPHSNTLLLACLDAYRLRRCDVEALMLWTQR